jgi:pimeloyl-[acyl-carrier protein] synthase
VAETFIVDRSLEDEIASFFALDYRLIADPYPLYRRIRAEAPVFRHVDKVLVARYEDCKSVLTSPHVHQGLAVKGTRFRSAAQQLADSERQRLAEMFGFLEKRVGGANGEHHMRLRKIATRAFTPKVVSLMRERITEIAEQLITPIPRDRPVEFIDAYAFHLPLIVISEMLDISPEDRDDLRRWANSLGKFVGADWSDPSIIDEAHDAVFNLRRYLTAVFDERRRRGSTTDLLAALIGAEGAGGEKFTEDELVAMITQFVFAGHETSTMFLGNTLVTLLTENRADWDLLCAEPARITAAVEELLRHGSPTHNIDKLAASDFEIAGVPVREGDTINVMIASANHDDAVFPDGDRLDFSRPNVGSHMTFGRGAHHCLGASLARLEAQVSLDLLTQRFPGMRLATDEVEWRSTHMNRGPETLPVVLG